MSPVLHLIKNGKKELKSTITKGLPQKEKRKAK